MSRIVNFTVFSGFLKLTVVNASFEDFVEAKILSLHVQTANTKINSVQATSKVILSYAMVFCQIIPNLAFFANIRKQKSKIIVLKKKFAIFVSLCAST